MVRKTGKVSASRRILASLFSGALIAGATTVALGAPAQAAAETVDDATFTWGLSGYAQQGIFAAWEYKNLTGDVTYLSGATQTEYVTEVFPATSFPANARSGPAPNAVKFTGGTGTVDPDTGAAELSWSGSYTVNAYPPSFNAPDEVYSNPTLSVAADGSGELTMEFVIAAGIDMGGEPFDEADFGRVQLATFSPGSISGLDSNSLRLTPDFDGVELDPAIVQGQVTECAAPNSAGSWPAEFVHALAGNAAGQSVSSHFFTTSCGGMNNNKPPLPIDVSFVTADGSDGGDTDGDIVVEVPEWVDESSGEFGWAFASQTPANLGVAAQDGQNFIATGDLTEIIVTDTRTGGTDPYSWSISGQVGDFTSGSNSFTGSFLGWTPELLQGGSSISAGDEVASSHVGGTGLGESRPLASSSAAASARIGAGLELVIPGSTPAGNYSAKLTITAIS